MTHPHPLPDVTELETEAHEDVTLQESQWKWEVAQRRQRNQQATRKRTQAMASRRSFRRAQQQRTPRKAS